MVVARVDSLTSAQWDDVRAIRGDYLTASLCTDPADRPAAEAAICRIYEMDGRKAPPFIWCQSPAAVRLMIRMLDPDSPRQRAVKVGEPFGFIWYVWNSGKLLAENFTAALALGREVGREFGLLFGGKHQIPEQLFTASRADVLSRPLGDLLGEPLGEAVQAALRGTRWPPQARDRTRSYCGLTFGDYRALDYLGDGWSRGGGQFHGRMAEFDALRQLGLVTYDEQDSERLDLVCTLIRSCGWWEPYAYAGFVTERPAVVRAETPGGLGQLRLHCPDGPAITYRDGWSVYAWHGTVVPASLIEEGWDAGAIMAERNAEIRRCAIEKLGWDQFEQHLTPVASSPDPGNPGQVLALYDLPAAIRNTYPGPVRLLLCSNGTPEPDGTRRRFALQVPPHHTDPVAAAAQLYGWTRREYAKLARRA
jgi:hypothetical protein